MTGRAWYNKRLVNDDAGSVEGGKNCSTATSVTSTTVIGLNPKRKSYLLCLGFGGGGRLVCPGLQWHGSSTRACLGLQYSASSNPVSINSTWWKSPVRICQFLGRR